MNQQQLHIPIEITQGDVARESSFGASLILCAKVAGHDMDKELQMELGVDKAQFSRWKNDGEGINWGKLKTLMEFCGNHAPVFWMLHQLGYDISSLRKLESETERELRNEREEKEQLQFELNTLKKHLKISE